MIIEITELVGELAKLKPIPGEYRPCELKIAVDEIGSAASPIDYLLVQASETINLDMHVLKVIAKGRTEASRALFFENLTSVKIAI